MPRMDIREIGTDKSGHYNHLGRPGRRGGSLPKGGVAAVRYRDWTNIDEATAWAEQNLAGALAAAQKEDEDPESSRFSWQTESAVRSYTHGSFLPINYYLRGIDSSITKSHRDTIDELDGLMARPEAVTTEGFAVGRRFGRTVDIENRPVGSRFKDMGFVSTSVDISRYGYDTFKDGRARKNKFLSTIAALTGTVIIRVPAGVRGVYVASISAYKEEYEFLLDRGYTFEVVQNDADGIVLEVVVE